jgi:2'-5' RNA ligase
LVRRASYLLELRLSGSAKTYVKNIVFEVANSFGVKGVIRKRVVPHVTIVGPITTTDERKLTDEMIRTCMNYDLMTIRFSGFRSFGNWLFGNRVIGVKIEPSHELEALRKELVEKLGFCQLSKFDRKEWKPHSTIAFKDIDQKFGEIKKYLENQSCPQIQHHVIRITLLKNARILCEYDFLQRRALNRYEALSRENRRMTLILLKKRL